MKCANHPERNSVGYCKKCGKFGCGECLIKVAITGPVGRQSRATEALLCRECLSGARPDLVLPKADKKPAAKPAHPARTRRGGKFAAVAAVAVLVAAGIVGAVVYLPHINLSHQTMSADEVAAEALEALSTGDVERFLSCVDVTGFVCGMDTSGLLKRDYEGANRARRKELFAAHSDYLAKDLFVPANMRKKYSLVKLEMKEKSASIYVKPWIQFGNRLYKRVVLEKKMGEWRICGLASPDY